MASGQERLRRQLEEGRAAQAAALEAARQEFRQQLADYKAQAAAEASASDRAVAAAEEASLRVEQVASAVGGRVSALERKVAALEGSLLEATRTLESEKAGSARASRKSAIEDVWAELSMLKATLLARDSAEGLDAEMRSLEAAAESDTAGQPLDWTISTQSCARSEYQGQGPGGGSGQLVGSLPNTGTLSHASLHTPQAQTFADSSLEEDAAAAAAAMAELSRSLASERALLGAPELAPEAVMLPTLMSPHKCQAQPWPLK
eukprot:SRR837773.23054.p2 GENE.SRR837773.23054~~SRR837773.23054.p2  ORF type:complete len:262 (+),score=102.24 SRR837773.23054:2-787(+)